ncbi:MAG: CHAT domain-containing protein, partial [Verrucomicrobiales bacterium]|nr:CHAT domain-containing protein [Verrucomicrobiales bacterium]
HDEASLVFTTEDYRRIIHENPAFQSMMGAILLTHALLFVGYSLSDPNFRLLIESQLSIFGTEAPPRYALMEGVGHTEAEILRRTAGIEVISYPKGRHEEVARFLGTIADLTGPSPPPTPPAGRLRSGVPDLPALTLSIRPHGALLDVHWYETTVRDLDGRRVPPERRWMASVRSLPWNRLAETALDDGPTHPRRVGRLLGEPFSGLDLPIAPGGRPRLVMLDLPPELEALPWEWMDIGGEPLALRAPVCRRDPRLDDASRGRPFPHSPLRVLLVGDTLDEAHPRHSLPDTREEVEAIRECFLRDSSRHHVTVVVGADACYRRVLDEITHGGYDIVHVAGVAYVDGTEESILPLHDGHVRASEVATLLIRRPPALVFLNADLSGFVPAFGGYRPTPVPFGGEYSDFYESLTRRRAGFERVVGRAGVGTFVGCMAMAQSQVARDLATEFYRRLLDGRPAAHALFEARRSRPASEEDTCLAFAMSGYPDAIVVPDPAPRRTRASKSRPSPAPRRTRPKTPRTRRAG